MKIKTVEIEGKSYAVLSDDKPVYVHDDGKEVPFDAPQTVATITRLNSEAKAHREGKETAEAALAKFAGIEDPAAAIAALSTVKNLSDKKLVDAGEVEKVKTEAIKAVRAEFEPIVKERDSLKNALHKETIGGRFSRSKFIADKLVTPVQMVEATFGKHFTLKDDRIVATGHDGKEIYSPVRHGELADFDEALEILVDGSPFKSSILKGSGGGGGGAENKGGGDAASKTISRPDFDALSQADRAAKVKDGFKVV